MEFKVKLSDISFEEAFSKEDAPNLDELIIDTYVEDLDNDKSTIYIKTGYGLLELHMIHNIMKYLMNNTPYIPKIRTRYPSTSLFNEAEKIFSELSYKEWENYK